MGQSMGIGRLGAPNIIIKRKFRFTLQIATPVGNIPEHYVKTTGRPNLEIDELELNFLNAVSWIAGKGKWQPITVTYIDTTDSVMEPLYSWISAVYELVQPAVLHQSEPKGYFGSAVLQMYDGCGGVLERWLLQNVWPHSINFGDLAYSESEEANIELSLKYSGVVYQGVCGPSPKETCQGC